MLPFHFHTLLQPDNHTVPSSQYSVSRHEQLVHHRQLRSLTKDIPPTYFCFGILMMTTVPSLR